EISDDKHADAKLALFQEIFDLEVEADYKTQAIKKKKSVLKERLLSIET
ncbi:glutamyl-tRNA reductase, partial [Staphylococcus pseudintermedius]